MKTWREEFEENYSAVPTPSQSGSGVKIKYVYSGPWYIWDVSDRQDRHNRITVLLLLILDLFAFLGAGVSRSGLGVVPYVGLPGLLALIPLPFELVGGCAFCMAKRKMTFPSFRLIEFYTRVSFALHGALALLTAIAAAYAMIVTGATIAKGLTVLGFFVSAGSAACLARLFWKLPYVTEKNCPCSPE